MDGDHSRLYGYGFSYMYLKQPVLALGFSGARVCSPTLRLRGLLPTEVADSGIANQ